MNFILFIQSFAWIICLTSTMNNAVETGIVMHDNCQNGSQMVKKMLSAASQMNNYSSHFTMVSYKDKNSIKEEGIFYFRKPRLLRVEVQNGPKKGALAILSNDGKIHGHLGGVLKFFQSTVSPNSEMARAINGYPMADSDFYSLAAYLDNMLRKGNSSLVTIQPIESNKTNSPAYILDIYIDGKNPDKRLLLKRIYIDPQTYLPIFWQDYTLGKLWSESSWQNLKCNLVLSDKLFQP